MTLILDLYFISFLFGTVFLVGSSSLLQPLTLGSGFCVTLMKHDQ